MSELRFATFLARMMGRSPLPSEAEITLFTQELAWMLRAEVPIGRAFDLLLADAGGGAMAPVLRGVRAELRAGSALAEAMARQTGVFPEPYLRLVALAERVGTLPMVLARLHEGRTRATEWRKRVGNALVYPAFLVVVAIGTTALILLAVLPQLQMVLPEMPAPGGADMAIRRMIVLSDWVAGHGMVLAFTALAISALVVALLNRLSVRLALTEVAARSPLLGTLIVQARLAEVTRTLAMLTEAGVPLAEAIDLTRRSTLSPALGLTLRRMGEALREGLDVTIPLREDSSIPRILVSLLKVGQETGNLGQGLKQAATIFEEKTRAALERFLSLLEPALILFISVAVGGLIYLVIGALMSVNDLFL